MKQPVLGCRKAGKESAAPPLTQKTWGHAWHIATQPHVHHCASLPHARPVLRAAASQRRAHCAKGAELERQRGGLCGAGFSP